MNSKERFFATIERRDVDHPACWLGIPVPDALEGLYQHFQVSGHDGLKNAVDDDIYEIEVPYDNPPSNHIACAFDFAPETDGLQQHSRTLTSNGFFAGMDDPSRIDEFSWPDPKEHMDYELCLQAFDNVPKDRAVMGIMWSAHFQDACAAFGMEEAMITMISRPDIYDVVIDRIARFYLEANEIFYRAAGDRMHAVLIGNDFGSQLSLMLSPELIRKHVFRGTKQLIDQAHEFGYKVIYHSCGAVAEIIEDLIDLGVDALHPIQALATGMSARELKERFGDKTSYCGGVDAQHLLVTGSPEDVRKKVLELRKLFPTGLVISPSHEAILPDINPANLQALLDAVRE